MKKGFIYNDQPDLIPSYFDFVYFVGLTGKDRDPQFLSKWNNESPLKRGVIHQPILYSDFNEYSNGSKFEELLGELKYSDWNNGVPFILDIWKAPQSNMFNLDHLRVYQDEYVKKKMNPLVKPLLRVTPTFWNALITNNRIETMRLLETFDILLSHWAVEKPATLLDIGKPAWWEYEKGKIYNDPTKEWATSVVIIPPVEPPPPEEEETVLLEIKTPIKWKVSLLGGLIKGTIEAVFEEEE